MHLQLKRMRTIGLQHAVPVFMFSAMAGMPSASYFIISISISALRRSGRCRSRFLRLVARKKPSRLPRTLPDALDLRPCA